MWFDLRRSSGARALVCALVAAALSDAAPAASAPVPAALVAPVDRLIAGIDAGSSAQIAAAYVAAPTIVDEFAPFHWSGSGAAGAWARDFAAVARTSAIAHVRVRRRAPAYSAIAGTRAWLVIPTEYAYDVAGKPQRERAAWTFVLVSSARGWRIEASTWAKTAGAP